MTLVVEKTLIGDKIHAARTIRGLTLQRLDEASGVSYSSINAIERGHREPRFGTVENLAKALDIDPMLLLNPTVSVEELQRRMAANQQKERSSAGRSGKRLTRATTLMDSLPEQSPRV